MTPGTGDLARSQNRSRQAAEAGLPFVAPDLQVDVHDVVVGDGQAAHPVVDPEAPLLRRGVVVPDDPDAALCSSDPVGAGRACRAELRRGSGAVDDVALRDRDLVDLLAVAERDLAEGAAERAVVDERDVLVDDQRTVLRDLNDDIGRLEREGLGLCGSRRSARGEHSDREAR